MQQTNTVMFVPTREQELKLQILAESSVRLWNVANYARRQFYFAGKRTPTRDNQHIPAEIGMVI
jgi:hypothetical protein